MRQRKGTTRSVFGRRTMARLHLSLRSKDRESKVRSTQPKEHRGQWKSKKCRPGRWAWRRRSEAVEKDEGRRPWRQRWRWRVSYRIRDTERSIPCVFPAREDVQSVSKYVFVQIYVYTVQNTYMYRQCILIFCCFFFVSLI